MLVSTMVQHLIHLLLLGLLGCTSIIEACWKRWFVGHGRSTALARTQSVVVYFHCNYFAMIFFKNKYLQ